MGITREEATRRLAS